MTQVSYKWISEVQVARRQTICASYVFVEVYIRTVAIVLSCKVHLMCVDGKRTIRCEFEAEMRSENQMHFRVVTTCTRTC